MRTSIRIITALFIMHHAGSAFALQGEPPLTQSDSRVRDGSTIERMLLPAVDGKKLLAEDRAAERPGVPMRFAVPAKLDITPAEHGTWQKVAGGKLWRMGFEAPGATDLNFGFTDYRLPKGAKLYVVSEYNKYYEGPYTAEHNKSHGILYTPVVPGDKAYLELFVPKGQDYSLRLVQVATGYRDMFKLGLGEHELRSGSCNNDVVCPEGDPWRNEIRSVARYSNAGLTLCTGQLVMDTAASYRPLFLSAFHCGVTPANAPAMVVYWNYESPICGMQSGGSLAQNQTGATYLSGRPDVDFLLVELNADPLDEWNVYWSGWDNSGVAALGSVGIHHPSGDEKAISFNDDLLTTVNDCTGGGVNTHWEVDNWEDGTTEGGSSGSGIWDPATKLLVGTLTGGGAACGNQADDCYGKFSVSWSGATLLDRLSDHLDPGGTGAQQQPGGEPLDFTLQTLDPFLGVCGIGSDTTTVEVAAQGSFGDDVTLSVSGLPAGVNASFAPNPVVGAGTSLMTVETTQAATANAPIVVTGTAASGSRELALTLELSAGVAATPALLFPADGSTGVSSLQKYYWEATANASSYDVEVATDLDFNNIVVRYTGIAGTSFAPPTPLADSTLYYWRVIANSPCGSSVSSVASFTTGDAACTVFASTDVPQTILLVPDSVQSTVTVAGVSGPIADVNVLGLRGTHTYMSDLDFHLSSPSGTGVQIMAPSCGSTDNFNLNLDDQAPAGAWPCPPVGGGTYRPSDPLAAYNTEDANGTWTLTVTDSAAQDGGELQGWGVEICVAAPSQSLDTDGDGIEEDADNCRTVANPDQCDTNGDGYGNLCDADLDNNGIINSFDLGIMRSSFGATGPNDADLTCNEIVNTFDLTRLRDAFGGRPGPSGLRY